MGWNCVAGVICILFMFILYYGTLQPCQGVQDFIYDLLNTPNTDRVERCVSLLGIVFWVGVTIGVILIITCLRCRGRE